MSAILQDFRYGFRMLVKNPGFTAVVVITLALGIGANTAVFSLVKSIMTVPFAVDDANKVMWLWSQNPEQSVTQSPISPDDFLDYREQSKSFKHLVAGRGRGYNFVGNGEPEQIQVFQYTHGFLKVYGHQPILGRTFLPEDEQPGAPHVAILNYSFWMQRFGGDPDALNTDILLDDEKYTIIGVGPEGFAFPPGVDTLWTPLSLERGEQPRDQRDLFVTGRLHEGITLAQADAEMKTLARSLESEYAGANRGWTAGIQTLQDVLVTSNGLAFGIFYGAISFVLLIACANIANLLLARATSREKEIALRTALGATRMRVIRQLLTESVVLGIFGGGLGLLAGYWGMDLIRTLTLLSSNPQIGAFADAMAIDTTVLIHTAGISLVAGLIFGLAPALQGSKPDLQATLKEGGHGSGAGSSRQMVRNFLVVAQVALALALLSTAGLFIRAFAELNAYDLGFDPGKILTFQVNLPERTYAEDTQLTAFYRQATEKLAAIPGVDAAATATLLPMTQLGNNGNNRVNIEGIADPEDSTIPNVFSVVVSPGYFRALDIEIMEGRALTGEDVAGSLPVAVVTQKFAGRYFSGESVIGRRIKLGAASSDNPWLTVVGITEDVRSNGATMRATNTILPHVFVPQTQNPARTASLILSTTADPLSFSRAAQTAVWEIDSKLALANILSHQQVLDQTQFGNKLILGIVGALAVIAMILAGVGIYGVISYSVSQRSHEIGIRMALGANPTTVLFLVVRQAAILTMIGLSLGLMGAYGLARLLGGILLGMNATAATGPATYVLVSATLLTVALVASIVPARRAMRVDPMVTLRYE